MKKKKNLTKKILMQVSYNPDYDFYDMIKSNPDEDIKEILRKGKNTLLRLNSQINKGQPKENERDAFVKAYEFIRDPELKKVYDELRTNYKKDISTIVSNSKDKSKTRVKVKDTEKTNNSEKNANLGMNILKGTALTTLIIAIVYGAYSCSKEDENIKYKDTNVNDQIEQIQDEEIEEIVESEEVYDVNYFDDAYDDEKIHARAVAIYNALVASNVMDITVEELEDQIRFINGSYYAATDMDAYEMSNNVLETFAEYGTAVKQAANFAGGVVSENGVNQAIYLDAFCLDNSEHQEFMNLNAILFVNVLTANTEEDKRNASIEYLKLQSDLMMGVLVDETGTQLNYFDLDNNEGYVYGIMSQIAAPVIKSALGQDYTIPYETNKDERVNVNIDQVLFYYNPQCNGEYDTENVWAEYLQELVVQSTINKTENTSLTLSSNNVESNE
ncbi:MAG: hypothetical protein ACI31M_04100 [Bacilli bacterium]